MHISKMFPSPWLYGVDLGGKDVTVKIKDITEEKVGRPGQEETKYVMGFNKAQKRLILNKTNCMVIAGIYGPETDNWVGKDITLYPAKVNAFGEDHIVVRVRPKTKTISAMPDDPAAVAEDELPDDDDDLWDLNVPEVNPDGDDEDVEGLIESWGISPPAAQQWAVDIGACKDAGEAMGSWKKIVKERFGDKNPTVKDIPLLMHDYYEHQMEKLA